MNEIKIEFDAMNAARRKAGKPPLQWETFRKDSVQARNIAKYRNCEGNHFSNTDKPEELKEMLRK
jgi:hypothetical protein